MNRYTDYRWLPRVLCAPGRLADFWRELGVGSAVSREFFIYSDQV